MVQTKPSEILEKDKTKKTNLHNQRRGSLSAVGVVNVGWRICTFPTVSISHLLTYIYGSNTCVWKFSTDLFNL